MNGYEAARLIRQQARGGELTMVALTGLGQEKDRLRSMEAGFDEHLIKPASLEALTKLLDRIGR
jgi:CheY-like chemotaxis protein